MVNQAIGRKIRSLCEYFVLVWYVNHKQKRTATVLESNLDQLAPVK
jgi:hypothetical protein